MYYNIEISRSKWVSMKKEAQRMAARLFSVSQPGLFEEGGQSIERRARRMYSCARQISWRGCDECNIRYITRANFCRDRLCPLCSWRRARRLALKTLSAMRATEGEGTLFFATFTSPNVPWDMLGHALDEMSRRWRRVVSGLGKRLHGHIRAVEISRGRDGMAHAHIHAVLHMGAWGLSSGELVTLWGGHVDLRWIRDAGAVHDRLALYMTKGTRQMTAFSDAELLWFGAALRGRRLWTAAGTLKFGDEVETSSALGAGAETMRPMPAQNARCPLCGGELRRGLDCWNGGRYYERYYERR